MPRVLRWRWIVAIALVSALPFLFVRIPPLVDVPGHIGRYAVELAPPASPLLRYFTFRWVVAPNLAADLLVVPLAPLMGLVPAVWLLCAAVPVVITGGVLALVRQRNANGASALPWALLFVYNLWFLYGFLNFFLVAAVALWALVAWSALETRPRLRAVLFIFLTPAMVVGHAVAAALMAAWITGVAIVTHCEGRRPWRSVLPLWPLAAGLVPLAFAPRAGGSTRWDFLDKLDAIATALQDQSQLLDIGTVGAALLVFLTGRFWGARLRAGNRALVLGTLLLFFAAPSILSGATRIDGRLVPFVPLLALGLQDWRSVTPTRRRWVSILGWTLLVLRFSVTTVSFADYAREYHRELAALEHVRPGSRVLNLSLMPCKGDRWRRGRTEHLANLATLFRQAWVNAHWTNGAVHLLQVRYRPRGYWQDPSQMVTVPPCVDPAIPFEARSRHGIAETLPRLPLDQVDYLWLIDVPLPPGPRDPRLVPVWQSNDSALYAIHHIKAT
ncbi:hypothetical protein ATB93_17930 [Sphingomonas sp. WG]|nr:hypothetical protein ATB93_17930 [Sphingomonas sp. WG]